MCCWAGDPQASAAACPNACCALICLLQEGRRRWLLQAALLLPVRHNRHPGVPAGALLFTVVFSSGMRCCPLASATRPHTSWCSSRCVALAFSSGMLCCFLASSIGPPHILVFQRVPSRLGRLWLASLWPGLELGCKECRQPTLRQQYLTPPADYPRSHIQIFRDQFLRALYSLFPEDAAPKYILDAGGWLLSLGDDILENPQPWRARRNQLERLGHTSS